ncbi:MAG: M20/M25/M40 family metallo-hydrolase [Pseudomonadota bacterium]
MIPELPFDRDQMLAGLKVWVECESPTFDADAVNRMMDLAGRDLAKAGASIERIAGRMGFGDCVRARFPHPDLYAPGILVLGHLDTVHPVGTLEPLPWKLDGDFCWGPGIQDMKGGNYIALEAARLLAKSGAVPPLPITFLFTSDEEVGSPSTRDLIEAEAARHKFILVPEPANEDGGVVTGRFAIARFNLETRGVPSHAGARLAEGKSAIHGMIRHIEAIEAMTTADCTFSAGVIRGGQWVNCVPSSCQAEVLSMAKTDADLAHGVDRMLALNGNHAGIELEVRRGVTRPVWAPGLPATMKLYEQARDLAGAIGFDLPHGSRGGGSDGTFTGALGLATLDGLGVEGDGLHTLNEHIDIRSLVPRAQLMASLMMTLA